MKTVYVALLSILMSCNSSNGIDPRVLTVPSFKMQLLDSTGTFNTADLKPGAPTIFLFFSPDCKYSHQQTKNIIENYSTLQNVNIFMCSSAPMQKLQDFSERYHLNRFGNITVGRDVHLFFAEQLKVPGFPWLFMYKGDMQLKRIATGFVDAKRILNELKG